MRKRLHLFFLTAIILAVAVAFFGCAGGNKPPEGVLPTPTTTPEVVLPDGITINGIDVGGLTEREIKDFFLDEDTAPTLGVIQVSVGEEIFQLDASGLSGQAQIEELLAAAFAQNGTHFTIEYTYDVTSLKDLVAELAQQMNVAPVDAAYVYDREAEGRFVYTPEVKGREVDPEAMFTAISAYVAAGDFSQPCPVDFNEVEPTVTLEEAKRMTTLIGTGTSSFAKGSYSAANRVFNIERAMGMFDGYILQPGEEFSFNTVLGPRYASTGWKSAGAINNGKSVEEPGGGVCQVSSTTFNAVLYADLTIINRAPHSWPLSYLPAGQDAMIDTNNQDFVFKNNRATPVVISTDVDTKKKEMTVRIYGEPLPGNQYVKLVSNKVGTVPQPADQVIEVKTMKPGTSVVDRKGRSGSRYETYKEYYAEDGTLIKRELAYKTTYRAISSIIHKGPDAKPADGIIDDGGTTAPPIDDTPVASSGFFSIGSEDVDIPDDVEELD